MKHAQIFEYFWLDDNEALSIIREVCAAVQAGEPMAVLGDAAAP